MSRYINKYNTLVLKNGAHLRNVVVLERLGSGATCTTYRGYIKDTEQDVIIKELFPLSCKRKKLQVIWTSDYFKQQKKQEFTNLYEKITSFQKNDKLNKNIVAVSHKIWEANNTFYMMQDYSNLSSFDKEIARMPVFNRENTSDIYKFFLYMKSLVEVVGKFHEEGYYLLDIAPANFAIDKTNSYNRNIYYLDFDSFQKDDLVDIIYTSKWAAPEVLLGKVDTIDFKSDVFSIGAVFYYGLFRKNHTYFDLLTHDFYQELKIMDLPEELLNMIMQILKNTLTLVPKNRCTLEKLSSMMEALLDSFRRYTYTSIIDPESQCITQKQHYFIVSMVSDTIEDRSIHILDSKFVKEKDYNQFEKELIEELSLKNINVYVLKYQGSWDSMFTDCFGTAHLDELNDKLDTNALLCIEGFDYSEGLGILPYLKCIKLVLLNEKIQSNVVIENDSIEELNMEFIDKGLVDFYEFIRKDKLLSKIIVNISNVLKKSQKHILESIHVKINNYAECQNHKAIIHAILELYTTLEEQKLIYLLYLLNCQIDIYDLFRISGVTRGRIEKLIDMGLLKYDQELNKVYLNVYLERKLDFLYDMRITQLPVYNYIKNNSKDNLALKIIDLLCCSCKLKLSDLEELKQLKLSSKQRIRCYKRIYQKHIDFESSIEDSKFLKQFIYLIIEKIEFTNLKHADRVEWIDLLKQSYEQLYTISDDKKEILEFLSSKLHIKEPLSYEHILKEINNMRQMKYSPNFESYNLHKHMARKVNEAIGYLKNNIEKNGALSLYQNMFNFLGLLENTKYVPGLACDVLCLVIVLKEFYEIGYESFALCGMGILANQYFTVENEKIAREEFDRYINSTDSEKNEYKDRLINQYLKMESCLSIILDFSNLFEFPIWWYEDYIEAKLNEIEFTCDDFYRDYLELANRYNDRRAYLHAYQCASEETKKHEAPILFHEWEEKHDSLKEFQEIQYIVDFMEHHEITSDMYCIVNSNPWLSNKSKKELNIILQK